MKDDLKLLVLSSGSGYFFNVVADNHGCAAVVEES